MSINDTWEQDGEGLPHGHDDDKHDRAKLSDGVEDEQLSRRWANAEDDCVKHELWVSDHESSWCEESTLFNERHGGEEAGEHVNPCHHLDARHFVLGKQLPLVEWEGEPINLSH